MAEHFAITAKNRVRRYPQRARYDKATVYAILDAAWVAHVAFVKDGAPRIIPTLFARRDDTLLLHGAPASGLLRHIGAGGEVAVSVALVDGLVVAKRVADLAVNYRSVVVFGRGRLLEDEAEKRAALHHLTERLVPGHWGASNEPTASDLRAVAVAEIAIESASAKVRTALPDDRAEARTLPVWAGFVPIQQVMGQPVTADYAADRDPPRPLLEMIARWASPPPTVKE